MTLLHTLTLVSIVASLAYLAAMAAAALLLALRAGGRREFQADDHDALSESRFTIPVSLILRLTDRHMNASGTIGALLGLNYPEFEVIIVAESMAGPEWDALKREWRLEAREFFYRQSLPTTTVRMIYRSERDARLMVVDKLPATAADAMNCGVNLARLRYVTAVDAGVAFDADALLRAMSAPMRDPANVVGATSHVEVAVATRPLQRLASIRSIMNSRLVWRSLQAGFGPRESVVVWRRDAVVQSGGFSTAAADADLDMMVRLQTSDAPGVGGQVVRTAEIFGRAEPRPFRDIVRATARRQLAALQAVAGLARSPRIDVPALLYFLMSELLTPMAQAWIVVATAAGAVSGWLDWRDFALAMVALSLGHAIVSGAALLLRGSVPYAAPGESGLRRLLVVAPFDFAIAGTLGACARTAGFLAFVKASLTSSRAA